MAARAENDAKRDAATLDEAARRRLEHDWRKPMSERLARMHELCRQITAIAGTARRK